MPKKPLRHHPMRKTSPAQLEREIAESLARSPTMARARSWQVGDKVLYQTKPYIIVRVAKPLEFWVKVRDKEPTHGVVSQPAYDLVAGDDPDSWDAAFLPQIQADMLRVR